MNEDMQRLAERAVEKLDGLADEEHAQIVFENDGE